MLELRNIEKYVLRRVNLDIVNQKVLLADEPTANLHSLQGREIMEIFRQLNDAGTSIIQGTHSEVNAAYGNRIIEIAGGWITNETRRTPAAAADR
jgi:ABC-type lipoprotein export system ATPase subunit